MCGIAGFWLGSPAADSPLEILKRMGDSISYRGPDDSGYFSDPAAGVGLVHRRLSILDLSPAGHQPMTSPSGRYVIVFNGEVFNFQEIRAELGEALRRGHSDTEIMLEAIERWGLDAAVKRFVGMFAFALWDRSERKLSLVRDRLGIKPLYYGHVGGHFLFASELKAIREFPEFSATIDRNVLALYMRHGYIPAPHSIYEGFNKLQPGCILSIGSAGEEPQIRNYWSAAEVAAKGLESPVAGSDAEVIEELHQTLLSAVGLRMIADVPLGAFLSGGIDSSAVVALMQPQSSRPIKTFTIGFHESGYNEATHAKRVAEHLGTDHTELYVTPQEALNVVPLLPSMYDEPFADPSQIPTYLVSKLARTSVTVSLSGDGGDELFGGYTRYLLTKKIWQSLNRFPKASRRIAAGLIHAVPPAAFDAIYRCVQPVIPKGIRWSLVGDKAHKLAGFFNADGPGSVYLGTLSQCDNPTEFVLGSQEPETIMRVIADSVSLPTLEEQMMLTDLRSYLPDDILTKVDRASMAVSLEARVPILDHRVVELAWRIPLHMKIRDGVGKWVLRQILYKYVPQELLERPKMGFGVPIEHWLRGPLRDWAEDLLSETNLREHQLLNVEAIRTKWSEHLSGRRNWQYLLWNVLVFQDWYRHTQLADAALMNEREVKTCK
jgi:asparagine synthase (glutamine-hydrolysing)